LALALSNQKSIFASRLYLLEFGRRCRVEDPRERIREILQALEGTLLHQRELVERAPLIAKAISKSAEPFEMTFG